MPGRRTLLLGAAAALGGCGFRPLYAPDAFGGTSVADAELNAVYVAVMPERTGQLLRQGLQRRFEGTGTGTAKRFELTGGLGIGGEGVAIQRDTSTTRIRLTGNATWVLRRLDVAHTVLTQGTARVIDGYNIQNQQYFAADLESEAAYKRIAETCADQITIQVAAFLRRQVLEHPA